MAAVTSFQAEKCRQGAKCKRRICLAHVEHRPPVLYLLGKQTVNVSDFVCIHFEPSDVGGIAVTVAVAAVVIVGLLKLYIRSSVVTARC